VADRAGGGVRSSACDGNREAEQDLPTSGWPEMSRQARWEPQVAPASRRRCHASTPRRELLEPRAVTASVGDVQGRAGPVRREPDRASDASAASTAIAAAPCGFSPRSFEVAAAIAASAASSTWAPSRLPPPRSATRFALGEPRSATITLRALRTASPAELVTPVRFEPGEHQVCDHRHRQRVERERFEPGARFTGRAAVAAIADPLQCLAELLGCRRRHPWHAEPSRRTCGDQVSVPAKNRVGCYEAGSRPGAGGRAPCPSQPDVDAGRPWTAASAGSVARGGPGFRPAGSQ
jgi:hypothetical protein